MDTKVRNRTAANSLLITPKLRETFMRSPSAPDCEALHKLRMAPKHRRYVAVDLADDRLRNALIAAAQPFMRRGEQALPPALVGSARRAVQAIYEYERRRANLDLFEDQEVACN